MRSRADPALRRNAYLRTVLLETGLGAQLNARFPVAAYVPSSSNDSSLSSSKTRQAETAESDPDTLLVLNLPMEGYCALHTSAIFKAVALFSARLKERREAERATAEGNDDDDDEMDEEEDQNSRRRDRDEEVKESGRNLEDPRDDIYTDLNRLVAALREEGPAVIDPKKVQSISKGPSPR